MLDKLSIRWKTVLIALLSLPLPLVSAAYAVYAVSEAESAMTRIAGKQIPISNAVAEIEVTKLEQAIRFERALHYGKQMGATPSLVSNFDANYRAFEADAAKIDADFEKLLALIGQAKPAAQSNLAAAGFAGLLGVAKTARAHHQTYGSAARDLFDALRQGDTESSNRRRDELFRIENKLNRELAAAVGQVESFTNQSMLTVQAQKTTAVLITIALAIVAMFGGPAIALAVARTVSVPITRLTESLKALPEEATEIEVDTASGRSDEIGLLTRAVERYRDALTGAREAKEILQHQAEGFKAAEARLRLERDQLELRMEERTQKLRESEQRFKDFALSSAERFWELDADLRFAWLDEPGRPDRVPLINSIIGKTRFEVAGADKDRDPKWRDHYADMNARRPFRDFEYEVGRGTDANMWWRISGVPTFSAAGEFTGYRGVGTDVTERKRAQVALVQQSADLKDANAALEASLAQRDTLLQELQHRVKNSLQVVVSLLNLRASQAQEGITKKTILEASQRVEALSLAHRFLYQPDLPDQTVLSDYIPALCKMLSQAYDIGAARVDVAIDVAPIALPLNKITPVSLLLNELVSNAFKHAFPGNRKGTISVRLDSEADESGSQSLHLCVADDGVGLPDELQLDAVASMGMKIFYSLVSQIDGTVEIDRGTGTAIHVRFHLEGGQIEI